MDAALKQRLIGAAVLVALAVIFLPMLVDGPAPQQGTSSVPLSIPTPPERSFETRELPVTPASPAPAAPVGETVDPDRVVTVQAENDKPPEAMPDDLQPVDDPALVDASGTPANAAASTPAAATVPVLAATPSTTTTPPGHAPDMTSTPLATTSVPSAASTLPAAMPGGRFVVNLGSYANVANANALVATMKSAGLAAYGDRVPVGGKTGLRVRVGPFAQRGEAEAARLAVTKVRGDVPASVVALDGAEAAAAPVVARAPAASGFAVQLGALKTQADADALRDKARAAGFVAYVERADTEAGALFRVRVGPEVVRANAEALKSRVKQKLAIDGVVVTHP